MQSLFLCRQQTNIVNLIDLQPNINMFIKSCLELGRRNMVEILAFDSKSIKSILNNATFDYSKEFPIIYKNVFNIHDNSLIMINH